MFPSFSKEVFVFRLPLLSGNLVNGTSTSSMKTITMDVLKDAANRLLFDMSDEQYKTLYEEFQILTKQMETIGKIEGLENYAPMTFPFDCSTTFLREDVEEKPLPREDALKNAGNKQDNQIKLPKVVLWTI